MDSPIAVTSVAKADVIFKIDDLNGRAWEVHITEPKLGLELSDEAKKLSEGYCTKED